MNGLAFCVVLFEMFLFGLMVGHEASKHDNPNEPKPKNWEYKLHKQWMKGFEAGEKSMTKRAFERLKNEQIIREMMDDNKADR